MGSRFESRPLGLSYPGYCKRHGSTHLVIDQYGEPLECFVISCCSPVGPVCKQPAVWACPWHEPKPTARLPESGNAVTCCCAVPLWGWVQQGRSLLPPGWQVLAAAADGKQGAGPQQHVVLWSACSHWCAPRLHGCTLTALPLQHKPCVYGLLCVVLGEWVPARGGT